MVGFIENIPVTFGDISVFVDFLVIEGSPFDVIIGDLTMEDLGIIIVLGKRKL